MLSLIEAPIEDKSVIAFVTEPLEFNLASLVNDPTKKDMIPSEIDLKCLVLELMEVVNFLHANAKSIHCNISPEHIYVTKTGKLKIGGLNFMMPFSSADPVPTQFDYFSKIGEFSLVPNLKFSAPEVSASTAVSAQVDIFSIGCIIYFLVALNQGRDPYLIQMSDSTS